VIGAERVDGDEEDVPLAPIDFQPTVGTIFFEGRPQLEGGRRRKARSELDGKTEERGALEEDHAQVIGARQSPRRGR
jgi:hypothetical protein